MGSSTGETKQGSAAELQRIGEVAEEVGLSLRTVRYYEEVGLLEPDERTSGGFRLYGEEQIARLGLIKRIKPLGLSINEMRELLAALDATRQAGRRDRGARDRLGRFAAIAEERCERLRRELTDARAVAQQLRREAEGD